ncbi:unnamed protein product [Ixodes pacificus]
MLRQAQRTWPVRAAPAPANSDSPTWPPNFRKERKRQKKKGSSKRRCTSGEERRGDQPWPIVSCSPRIRAVFRFLRGGSPPPPPPPNSKERNKKEAACLLAEKTEVQRLQKRLRSPNPPPVIQNAPLPLK